MFSSSETPSTVSPAASDTLCQLMLTSECDFTQRSSLSSLLSLTQVFVLMMSQKCHQLYLCDS